jgi:FkbM family methyltransferase
LTSPSADTASLCSANRSTFVSYAQNHEDVVLARALRPDERTGFWVDVGAGHPVYDSVTAAFSERGWRGVNIEPLPQEFAELEAARPHDVNLRVAVGSTPGVGKLFEGPPENRGSSTMVAAIAGRYVDAGQQFVPIEVEIRTLADIVAEHVHGPVDFLKIDVEGMEHEVLASVDWSTFRPRVVMVEATVPNSREPSHESWESLLLAAGYRFTLFDGLNRIYVDEGEPELTERLQVPANVLDDYEPSDWARRAREAAAWLASVREQLDEVDDLRRQLADLARTTRRAQDDLATALEDVAELRDDLGASQLIAARALGEGRENERLRQQIRNLDAALEAMHNTRTYRYLRPIRRAYSLSRKVAKVVLRG